MSSDPEAVFQLVRREYLPKEYGGTAGAMKDISLAMEEKLCSYGPYFQASQNFGTQEKLRELGDRVQSDHRSSFGAVGSFRKLEID